MEKKLSVILLSYYSKDRIARCYDQLREVFTKEVIPFEFIIVDDGSKDDSFAKAAELEAKYDNVRAYALSRNYTSHYSIFAGLSKCTGACAIPLADDEQLPYEDVVAMYRLWQQGKKVIIPHRRNREDSFVSRKLSELYYTIMNALSDVQYPKGGADTFLIDRELIDIINTRVHPINTSSISEVLRLGFDPYYYGYDRPLGLNKNTSRWTFRKKWRLAKDNFFSASTFPIKLIAYMGSAAFVMSLLVGSFYTYIVLWGNKQFWGVNVPGWTFLVVLILALGGLILLSLSMIAEYIWRIYEEVKNRPGYIIKQ